MGNGNHYLNKAVVEVKPEQDGGGILVGGGGFTDYAAHYGLHVGAAIAIEPNFKLPF